MSEKVAIITAAGQGIGAAIATELAASGYKVSLLSNSGGAVKLAQELGGSGLTGSVTSPADLAKLVEVTLEKYGRIDAVVNNTGHPPKGELLDHSDDDWHRGLELLILNVVRLARLVTPIQNSNRWHRRLQSSSLRSLAQWPKNKQSYFQTSAGSYHKHPRTHPTLLLQSHWYPLPDQYRHWQ